METNVSSLGQGPGLAWKRSTSSFPPGSLTALKDWNVSNVTNMFFIFNGCTKIQKIGIPSIANGGQKLVENAKDANLTTVLPSIVSEDGSMGPYTWPELYTEMTTNPAAFQEGTVWVRANEEAAQ